MLLISIVLIGKQFNANQLQNGEGSGLGLWVSKGFIEQHNGTITARSEGENKGSTFIVELPVMQKCADFVPSNDDETSFQMKHCDMNKKNRAVSKVAPDIEQGFSDMSNVPNYKHNIDDTPPVGNGCSARSVEVTLDKIATDQMRAPALVRILVVDDAVTNRKIICRMLESYGYIVEQAINGKEAIDRIKQNAMGFDLILMDFEMPLMNGPSATRIIREELSLNVPIFGLTGNVLEEDVRYFMDSGANVVLHKPLSYPQLGAEMKKYVEKLKYVSEDEEY